MFSDLQQKTVDAIEDATSRFRRPMYASRMPCNTASDDAVRSAGILLLAGSAAALAWMAYRACTSCRTATPRTADDYDDVDQTGMDSFPASDPPSYNARPAH